MLKLNKVRFFKALTMTALLANDGIGADEDHSTDKNTKSALHKLGGVSTNPFNMTDLIKQKLHDLDQRTRVRQDILRSPRTFDLAFKPFSSVRSFLDNARSYNVKTKLTVYEISESQINELFTNYSDAIEELNWDYRPKSISDREDLDEDTGTTPWQNTTTGDTDDDDDDEDEETTETGKTGGDWDNHIDRSGVAVPAPRRAVARMRDPLGLGDLLDNPGQEANLVPRNKFILEPMAASAVKVAANDQNESDGGINATRKWQVTLVSDEQARFNTSSIQPARGAQPHALVKLFCRGYVAVQS